MNVANIFSPKASRIIRVLLTHPKHKWSVLGLSKEAKVGYGHTYRTIKTLLKIGLCRRTETNKIIITNPSELLTRWANYHDFTLLNELSAYYYPFKDINDLIDRLSHVNKKDLKYALTLHAGASLVAPYVRPVNVHIYVKRMNIGEFKCLLNLQLTELGGNVFLVVPYDEGVFYNVQNVRGVWVASNVQLYVDLYNYPARGREAAEYLRKRLIGF